MIAYRSRGLINLHVCATTVIAVGFFFFLAEITRFITWFGLSPEVKQGMVVLGVGAGMFLSGQFLRHLRSRLYAMGWPSAAWLGTRQVAMVALTLFTIIVATKDRSISRLFLAVYLLMLWAILTYANRRLPKIMADWMFGRQHRMPTLFVGKKDTLDQLDIWITQMIHLGVYSIGYLSDQNEEGESEMVGKRLGGTNQLLPILAKGTVSQVIVVDLPSKREETVKIVEACQAAGARLLIYDNVASRLPVQMTPVLEQGRYFYTAQDEPLEDPMNRAAKRTYDIAISLPVVLLILPPLAVLVWVVQRFQAPGPLFFVRPRGGQQRTEFMMFKFRSMYFQPANKEGETKQAQSRDSRIYPFGRFLRKTSLDEIPQFWNVLVGQMSVVGPRPHLPQHDYEFSQVAKAYRTRQLVKPGITGLAQVWGFRGEITDPTLIEQRVVLDIAYITQWSLWLDIQITFKTLKVMFKPPRTAY